MLFARCISNGVKFFCPDVFDAPVYTPEEMGVPVDGDGNVLEVLPAQAEIYELEPLASTESKASSPHPNRARFKSISAATGHTVAEIKSIAAGLGLPADATKLDELQSTDLRNALYADWAYKQGVFAGVAEAVTYVEERESEAEGQSDDHLFASIKADVEDMLTTIDAESQAA